MALLSCDRARFYKENKWIIAIHNHANNYPPSLDDGASAKTRGYESGVVVSHDGHIYTYGPTDEYLSTDNCDMIHDLISEEYIDSNDLTRA